MKKYFTCSPIYVLRLQTPMEHQLWSWWFQAPCRRRRDQPLPWRRSQSHYRDKYGYWVLFKSAWYWVSDLVDLGEFKQAMSETKENKKMRRVTVDKEGGGGPKMRQPPGRAPEKGGRRQEPPLSQAPRLSGMGSSLCVFINAFSSLLLSKARYWTVGIGRSPPELNMFISVYIFLEDKVRNQWY